MWSSRAWSSVWCSVRLPTHEEARLAHDLVILPPWRGLSRQLHAPGGDEDGAGKVNGLGGGPIEMDEAWAEDES